MFHNVTLLFCGRKSSLKFHGSHSNLLSKLPFFPLPQKAPEKKSNPFSLSTPKTTPMLLTVLLISTSPIGITTPQFHTHFFNYSASI
ncbi:hypothetical protein RJT34_06578 [Clitoria ternatea]|uniref:Uncharacterized protein n=1 Tax=Clitoria ternatea TaxID=43366 RepID=A0AAN9PRU3_CLITE